jgi:hypothetical protein
MTQPPVPISAADSLNLYYRAREVLRAVIDGRADKSEAAAAFDDILAAERDLWGEDAVVFSIELFDHSKGKSDVSR